MSDGERLRILRMVAGGTLTADEADELLAVLEPVALATTRVALPPAPLGATPQPRLVIRVSVGDQPKVNARIPLDGRGDVAWLHGVTEPFLSRYDLNLQTLVEHLGEAPVDGPLLDLQDGDTVIWIGVEAVVDPQRARLPAR